MQLDHREESRNRPVRMFAEPRSIWNIHGDAGGEFRFDGQAVECTRIDHGAGAANLGGEQVAENGLAEAQLSLHRVTDASDLITGKRLATSGA